MHIVLTVNQAWNIWNFRQPVVESFIAQGHRVTVLAPPDETVAKLQAIGAQFEPFAMDAKSLGPSQNLMLLARFRSAFRRLRPDVICSYTIKNNLFGALAARSLGIPFIPNVTGLGTVFLGNRVLSLVGQSLYRISLGASPVVFVQNEDDRDFLIARGILRKQQLRLLPGSGIDTRKFIPTKLPGAEDGYVFLMISRLLRDKGIVEFLEAARAIRLKRPNARFQVLGPLGSNNRTALSQDDLQPYLDDGSVSYLGATDDVRPFIEKSHCVVLPSYREGAPRALIEASSMGRPLIATDVPGCRSVIDDGITGILCKAADAGDLAAAMCRMLDHAPSTRQAMGDAGREKMLRQYSVELVIKAYLQAIAELTSRSQDDQGGDVLQRRG